VAVTSQPTLDMAGEPQRPAPPAVTLTAGQLLDALRRHYIGPEPLPGGVFLTELQVPDREEHTVRRADAVYLSFTRARGHAIDVHEVKVTRGDFLRELDRPQKAEAWWKYSSRWWIVSPHPTITPPDLLPEGWGLMCPGRRGRRFTVIQAPAVRHPTVDLTLLIELAKRLDLDRARLVGQAEREAEYARRELQLQAKREERLTGPTDEQQRRLEALADLERLTGVRLTAPGSWHPAGRTAEEFAAALRLAMGTVTARTEAVRHLDHLQRQVDATLNVARRLAEELAQARATLGETR
jgi:hypothetical protein